MEKNGVQYRFEKQNSSKNFMKKENNAIFNYRLYNSSSSPKKIKLELPVNLRGGETAYENGDWNWGKKATKNKTVEIELNISPEESIQRDYYFAHLVRDYLYSVTYRGDVNISVSELI